jgi:hypothetical protein
MLSLKYRCLDISRMVVKMMLAPQGLVNMWMKRDHDDEDGNKCAYPHWRSLVVATNRSKEIDLLRSVTY